MKRGLRTASGLAWSLFVLGMLLAALALTMGVARGHSGEGLTDFVEDLPWFLSFVLFIPVGFLVASRHPGNLVGWIILIAGLSAIVEAFSYEYAAYSLFVDPGSLPGGSALAWLATIAWAPEVALLPVALLRFPDGRLLSGGWKVASWVPVAWLVAVFGFAIALWPHRGPRFLQEAEGFGIRSLETAEQVIFSLYPLVLLSIVASLISLIIRFRRSRGKQRQQLKWIALAAAAAITGLTLTEFVLPLLDIDNPVAGIVTDIVAGPGVLALAAGIAMLRHQLYDIDVIINRTLVYGALTAVLALIYVAGVLGVGAVARTITDAEEVNNSFAVAASTLGVAALFRPGRKRIQTFIDRRFYRAKYDATKTIEVFSAKLRNEVDLDELSADLLTAIRKTMQPSHASLWLRST